MEGNVLFNDALNTFYLRLYDVGQKVKNHSDSESGNPLPSLHGLVFPINNKGSFVSTIPQTGTSRPRGGSRFPLSLSGWSFTICLTPCNRK